MSELTEKSCKVCEGGVAPLTVEESKKYLGKISSEWVLRDDAKEIQRSFKFKNYYQTIAFVNAMAWIAHIEDHHPDIEVSYNRCLVRYSTHAIKGLSENDFICAAKIDNLVAKM